MLPNNCSNCGAPYTDRQKLVGYETEEGCIECYNCDHKVWDNPIPVAVWVQPVDHQWDDGTESSGLAIAKRAIEPRLGTWSLLGGHLKNGETAEQGGRREWTEETGLFAHADCLRPLDSHANGKGHILLPILPPPITLYEWTHARLCKENSALDVLWSLEQGITLGFPIHQTIAEWWFNCERSSAHRWPTPAEIAEVSEWMKACLTNPARAA